MQLRYTDGVETTHPLTPGVTLIGRHPSCNIVLTDPTVSRHHARIQLTDTRATIVDIGSRFGTFLNGRRVKEQAEFKAADELRLGELTMKVEQHVSEQDLLSEDHEVSEGPGTIVLPMPTVAAPEGTGVGLRESHVLRLLADVGRTLLSSRSLSDVLAQVVDMAFEAVPAERAFLMLRESSEQALSARVLKHRDGTVPDHPTLSRMVVRRVMRDRVAILAADARSDAGLGVTDSIVRFNIRSFMCAPIWSGDEILGVLYVDSPKSSSFKPTDLDVFTAMTNAAAIAIEQARLTSQLVDEQRRRERLQRYHSPAVVNRILNASDAEVAAGAQERDVTVMFCDLVGFTAMCDRLPAVEAAAILNTFLTEMTDVVFDHEGTLDKFLGDALLAVFGAPLDQPDHAMKAVRAALAMRKALAELNRRPGATQLEMRIAINSGMAVTGDIGSPRRREFTVLGDTVNTAARIEVEVAAPGQIVMSGATFARLGGQVAAKALEARTLRGRSSAIELYCI